MSVSTEFSMAVLTRPQGRNADLGGALLERGWQVTECPALEIQPVILHDVQSLATPDSYDLVIFVSVPAVQAYHQHLSQMHPKYVWPKDTHIGCVGQASGQAIREAFGQDLSLFQPDKSADQDSESLWNKLIAHIDSIRRVLIVRGQDGRDWLASRLTEKGVKVDFYVAYCRNPATWSPKNIDMFKTWAQSAKYPVWLLTSAHAIKSSLAQFREHDLVQWAKKCCFILTHPRQETVLIQGLNKLTTCSRTEKSLSMPKILISRPLQEEILSNFEHFRDNHRID